jgi:hypothetical protein
LFGADKFYRSDAQKYSYKSSLTKAPSVAKISTVAPVVEPMAHKRDVTKRKAGIFKPSVN